MGGNHVPGHRVRRLSAVAFGFLLVFVAVSMTWAADDISVTALKSGYIRAGTDALGNTVWVKKTTFNASWWQNALGQAGAEGKGSKVSKYFEKLKSLSSGTIGSLGKKALRGGVYGVATQLALQEVIDGAGWAFNELQNQVQVPGTDAAPLGETVYCLAKDGQDYCANAPGQLLGFIPQIRLPSQQEPCGVGPIYEPTGGSRYWCTRTSDGVQIMSYLESKKTRPITGWPSSTNNYNPSSEDVPVSDVELGERIRENPGLVNTLLTDPRTGTPVSTPEMQQMIDELKEEIRNREGFDPQDPTPTPDLNDDTETPGEGTEWPSFCSWASVVCEFIDWYKSDGDEDVELPETELDIEASNWSSGIGGGSCPVADSITVSVLGTSGDITFDWQPLCSGATKLRPFLIAVCLMVAAFIIAGLRISAV